ncbi:MAG: DNA-directed RNA polymerase subunit beta' [Candidatus Cloacimonetes bacterium]|nr:DNA-directed RNA polymerase subunit beta' [Candidatus Cloacimonadota bacterium]
MIREIKREKKIEHYDNVRIKIATPETIREWSYGEVTKPDTLNYRTLKPEKDGLFCERIFGPERDYECSCGKYKKKRFANTICDRCGVEVTSSRVRRNRMGHIELAVPVAHIWFVKSPPSKIGTLLDLTIRKLERVLYYESYIVIDPGESDYEKKDLIDTDEYYEIRDKVGEGFVAMMGAEAVRILLEEIELEPEAMNLRAMIKMETSAMKKQKAIKKLKVVDAFRKSGNRPESMILEVLPVLPPTLRPLVPLEGGRFATADFNDLYRRVITRNNRLKQLLEIRAPEVILRNEKRMLQESLDALIDNSRKSRPVKGRGNRALKSLTDQLKGKQGRFRQNLLGKRVDYSGRSVITVGPQLSLHQCGLPKEMAVELFKPFIIERLERYGEAEKTKTAKKLVEKKQPQIWKILEEVIRDFPVLLNRAPTLHRLGIQAFMPVLTEGKAIELHPMVCVPFNADFDGDQMGVYVPLTQESQMEARVLMLSSRNLLLPANGTLAMTPNQDIVLGCFYLTTERTKQPEADKDIHKLPHFSSSSEVFLAYDRAENARNRKGDMREDDKLNLHSWIRLRMGKKMLTTTVGRVIFNDIFPAKVPFQNYAFDKGKLNEMAMICYKLVGQYQTAIILDQMKELGFNYATRAGATFSIADVIVPEAKGKLLAKAEAEVGEIIESYMQGGITDTERYNRVVDRWKIATERVTNVLMDDLKMDRGGFNSIYLMYISGARGGKDQIKQLGGMRGLMDKPTRSSADIRQVIETPIKSNFREGLSVVEYFLSTHGARKGQADTALKTADAGYLTRRLVDVAQNAIITMEDCGTIEGIEVFALKEGLEVVESLGERVKGRTAAEDIFDPVTDKLIVSADELIDTSKARQMEKHGIMSVRIRSVLTCESQRGICAKCYGRNLANGKPVIIGEPVGIVAAQSIGEPGTQLTLRTFHIGGTASTDVDVAEVSSNFDGIIRFEKMNSIVNQAGQTIAISHLGRIRIEDEEGQMLENFKVEYASIVHVKDGEKVVQDSTLFTWDHYNNPLLATRKGTIKFENFVKDTTYKEEFNDLTGTREVTIIESKDRALQPQITVLGEDGTTEQVPLPTGLSIEVEDGQYVYPGSILGKSSRITVKQRDITGGLPRVQDLFEARVPKEKAVISEINGVVTIGDYTKHGRIIYVEAENAVQKKYVIPPGKRIIVHQGDIVDSGDALSDGPLDPHDILKAKGIVAAQMLILNEIQEIYRKQGVKIDDKHVGVIIRQMLKKVRIADPGHTLFLEGEIVDKNVVGNENERIEAEGGQGATFEQLLLGITKAALLTDSWLSAASFQETQKVLTQAAIEGKVDRLEGLKESIILGHRIPVGTGTKHYTNLVKDFIGQGKTVKETVEELAFSQEEGDMEDLLDY